MTREELQERDDRAIFDMYMVAVLSNESLTSNCANLDTVATVAVAVAAYAKKKRDSHFESLKKKAGA